MLTIIGAVNIDVIATALGDYRPKDSNPAQVTLSVGGVAMNYAHNLRLLGEEVRFITAFSDDDLGKMAQGECDCMGIDTSLAEVVPQARANVFVGVHNRMGELESAACDAELTETHMTPDFLARHIDRINASELVMVDANLGVDALAYLLGHCQAPLMIDGVSVAKTERLVRALALCEHPRVHTLKLNKEEYAVFLTLTAQMNLGEVIDCLLVTQGEEGVTLYQSTDSTIHQTYPALPVEHVVSTLGAGDAFLSGWAYAFLHHYPQVKAIDFAQHLAVKTLAVAGAVNTSGTF